jgi:hypothetical protein
MKKVLEKSYDTDCPGNWSEDSIKQAMGQWEDYKFKLIRR